MSNSIHPASRKVPVILSVDKLPGHLQLQNRGFQGIPSIEGAGNGRLWATWYGGVDNAVLVATNASSKQAWEFMFAVDTPGDIRCFDPCLWMNGSRHLWLFWSQAVLHGKAPYVWAMVAENPGDRNANWSGPFRACPGVLMNKSTALSSGTTRLPVSNWKQNRYSDPSEDTRAEIYSLDPTRRMANFFGGVINGRAPIVYDYSQKNLWAIFQEDEIERGESIHADSKLRALINKAYG